MTTGRKKIPRRPQPREFNITGSIIPEEHYYVDPAPTLKKLMELVEKKRYFVINRPRQFGKTTTLNFLAQRLQTTGEYAPALISFEDFTQRADMAEAEFYLKTAKRIAEELAYIAPNALHAETAVPAITDRDDFFDWLREICKSRKLVLLIDEIDAAPVTVVIGFLAGLRNMYLQRSRNRKPAPHAVVLAGVHDIKNLKARYRDETQTIGSASPFNIAIDYELAAFSRKNIRQYYWQHTAATGQEFDDKVISRMHEVTNGHPWLVSVLAKLLVEKIVPNRKQQIRLDHAERAIQELLAARNPNFESLIKNARHANLFPIVLDLLEGKHRRYSIQNDAIDLGVKYGIFAAKDRQLSLANPIYAQALYENFEKELEEFDVSGLVAANEVQDSKRRLDFRQVLDKFQAFMKAKGAMVSKHGSFREATGQLLLLSYLDLLVNGKGWTFKEPQSGEGRIDVVCCYGRQKEVVELKLWYGVRRYAAGLAQLVKYLDREGLDHGYLFVFDRRENTPREYSFSEHTVAGKKIQAWVV
ncbi:MAG: AAA-like domain-containing protein [bacterium]